MPDNWTPSTRFARAWRSVVACLCLAGAALLPVVAHADARSQAKRIHDRLAGVPPTEAVLTSMASDIAAGRETDAAYTAMCHFHFDSVESFMAAFSPSAAALQADIPNYTDVVPIIQVNEVLISR